MPSNPLPPDPSDVEQALARRSCPEPSADLRERILTAVSAERDDTARPLRRQRWKNVWQAAAALVVVVNLWMTAVNTARIGRLFPLTGSEGDPALRAARNDTADTSDSNDPLQRLVARAVANLRPAPQAGALGRHFFSNEEDREWALP
jgi:hypothetical protein